MAKKMFSGRMMRSRMGLAAGSILLLIIAYLSLAYLGIIPKPFACNSETKRLVTDISGGDFEITYTNCDALAKEEFVSVYVTRTKGSGNPILAKLLNKRTLLFRYDPAMVDSPLPLVTTSSPGKVLISIPRVSSVLFQRRSWERTSIDYNIAQIDYPETGSSQSAH
jgi:hypothetical protein